MGTPHAQLSFGHSFGLQADGRCQQSRKLIRNSGQATLACLIDDSLLGNFNSFRQRCVCLAGNCDRDFWRFRLQIGIARSLLVIVESLADLSEVVLSLLPSHDLTGGLDRRWQQHGTATAAEQARYGH
jgi:hypothetical protein